MHTVMNCRCRFLSTTIGAKVVVGVGSSAGGGSTGYHTAYSFTELPLQADAVAVLFRAARTWAVSWHAMHTCLPNPCDTRPHVQICTTSHMIAALPRGAILITDSHRCCMSPEHHRVVDNAVPRRFTAAHIAAADRACTILGRRA